MFLANKPISGESTKFFLLLLGFNTSILYLIIYILNSASLLWLPSTLKQIPLLALTALIGSFCGNLLFRDKLNEAQRTMGLYLFASAVIGIILAQATGILGFPINGLLSILFCLTLYIGIVLFPGAGPDPKLSQTPGQSTKYYKYIYIAIAVFFLLTKVVTPILYQGSYIDEFTHIFSAVSLTQQHHFAEFYTGSSYLRGSYLSVALAIIFSILGPKVIYAKLFIGLIGIINFFLLSKITRYLFDGKDQRFRLITLFIYALSSWILFQDFYIRFYVFYELFILIITLLSFRFVKFWNSNQRVKARSTLIAFALTILTMFLLSYDAGRIMILFFAGLNILYIYIFHIGESKERGGLVHQLIYLKQSRKIWLSVCVVAVCLLAITLLMHKGYIDISNVFYTSPSNLKYDHLFFDLNAVSTVLFFMATIFFLKNKEHGQFDFIIPTSCIFFIVNLFIPLSLQNTRSIIYFLPIYYAVASIGLAGLLRILNTRLWFGILVFALILQQIYNIPSNFLLHPYLPKEIDYIDYSIYQDAKNQCDDSLVIVASSPGAAKFFGLQPAFYLNTKFSDPNWIETSPDAKTAQLVNDQWQDTYSHVNIISNLEDLRSVINGQPKVCILAGGFPYSWLDNNTRDYITRNFYEPDKQYISSDPSKQMRLYRRS